MIIKIFSDLRKKYNSSKIVILYHAILINCLESQISRISDLILAVIIRKINIFKFKIPDFKDKNFYFKFGFDKKQKNDKIVFNDDSEEYVKIIDSYSILYFGVIG